LREDIRKGMVHRATPPAPTATRRSLMLWCGRRCLREDSSDTSGTRATVRRRWILMFLCVVVGTWCWSLGTWLSLPWQHSNNSAYCVSVAQGALKLRRCAFPPSGDPEVKGFYDQFLPVAYSPKRMRFWNGFRLKPVWAPRWDFEAGTVEIGALRDRETKLTSMCLVVPLWMPAVAVAIVSVLLFCRNRPARRGHCQRCGYNLTGADHTVCPECGTAFEEALSQVRETRHSRK